LPLIKCPDCGRDVSDLAPSCPNCGRPTALTQSPRSPTQPQPGPTPSPPPGYGGGLLRSNVSSLEISEPQPKTRSFPIAGLLLGLLVVIVGAGAAYLILASNRTAAPQAAVVAPTPPARQAPTLVPTVSAAPANQGRAVAAAGQAQLPDVNGISCDALESTIFHLHAHVAIFVNGAEQVIPFGVGIGQPWQVSDSAEGPFVDDGTCFYWIHTHTEDGVLHIESPVRRTFTLGDFFAIWQVPLSANQMGPIQGAVIAYVNGSKVDGDPSDIPLTQHAQIQLDSGQDVAPYVFRFPPGT
jgi:hypothetical protein